MNFDRNKVERVRRQYPVGTRIQLHSLCNNERDMPPGLCGTVVGVDDQPSLPYRNAGRLEQRETRRGKGPGQAPGQHR